MVEFITDQQRKLLEHSLGGENPEKWHRNHFMASPGHTDLDDLRTLQDKGLMETRKSPAFCDPDSILFMVTEAGKNFLTENPSSIPDGRGTYRR